MKHLRAVKHLLHNQGQNANYLEVVEPADAGTVRATGNTFNNLVAATVPIAGVRALERTGAWWPFFAAMGGCHVLSAVAFAFLGGEGPASRRGKVKAGG